MLEKRDNVVFSNYDIDPDDVSSDIPTFFSDSMGHNTIDLNNINLDDDYFDKDDPTYIVFDKPVA